MKRILPYLFLASIFMLSGNFVFSQNSDLPSKEEKETKLRLERIYSSNAQRGIVTPNHLMVTGPEQNCNNAIPVCMQTYPQNVSYTGHGSIQELSSTCLLRNESNSVWYTFTVQNSGNFGFMLNTANDYDFALYDITTIGCAGVPSATPIRCNYSATYGTTGLDTVNTSPGNLSYDYSQPKVMPGINVTAGQTFALIIDNFSANSNGYTLTFGGSAQIFDQNPPLINSINASCTVGTITVNFNEPIVCGSIDGSEFSITGPLGPVTVTSVTGNCIGNGAFATSATVSYVIAGIPTGTYTLSTQAGSSDNNTIRDNCGNFMASGLTQTFTHLGALSITSTNPSICAGNTTTIIVSGGTEAATYSWTPVAGTNDSLTVSPNVTTNYNVTVTYGACTGSITQPITITNPPIVTVNPVSASLCSGTTNVSASATVNGALCTNCDFAWTGGATQNDNNTSTSTLTGIGAGTYSVQVTSNTGCVGNTAVSTINIASPSATASCDIIYVSVAGGGNGLTKATPTNLVSAVAMAQCNNSVLKLQVGDYVIDSALTIGSLITIEGGYNNGFTLKTSGKDTTGVFPQRGTRILRRSINPEGVAGQYRVTAINVTPSSAYFRLQDLIITVRNANPLQHISNYGVYLGNGCNNYNIVRCSINAGRGSDGANGTNGTSYTGRAPDGANGNGSADSGPVTGGAGGTNATHTAIRGGNGGQGGTPAGTTFSGVTGLGTSPGSGGIGSPNYITGEIDCGGSDDPYPTYDVIGRNGIPGTPGTNATVAGANGSVYSFAGGYFIPGSDGGDGQDGTNGSGGGGGGGGGGQDCNGDCIGFCNDAHGAGGGGGGAGGLGATKGTGAKSAGGAFAIFAVNASAGNVVDCKLQASAAAGPYTGGTGGTGENGGLAGSGGGQADGGPGGNGGAGGKGGNSTAGGSAQGAVSYPYVNVDLTNTPVAGTYTNLDLNLQAVITAENIACTNTDIDYTANSANPNWTNFGANSAPSTGTGTPFNDVEYSATGFETVTLNSDVTNTITSTVSGAAQTFSNTAANANMANTACPTPVNNAITVAGYPAGASVASSGITVRLSTSHTYAEDMSIFLETPTGQILGLTHNRGNDNSTLCNITNINFSDAGAGVMPANACPTAGSTFRPEATTFTECSVTSTITSFGAINGGTINPNGVWRMRMVDEATNDVGGGIAVGGWSISFPAYSNTSTSTSTANQNDVYTDFLNIKTSAPSPGSILASATQICPDTALFNSTVAGTPGFTFNWSVSPSAGVTVINATSSSTGIVFPNATSAAITYTVNLQVSTECCGMLTLVQKTITVNPIPAVPTVSAQPTCTGGSGVFNVTNPAGASFDWYNSSTGGSSIHTGTSYSVSPVNGPQTYYVQSINSDGCESSRIPVTVSDTAVTPPAAIDVMQCDTGIVQVGAGSVPGSTIYNWYQDMAGTVLLQSGPSLTYGVEILTQGGSVVVYVSDSIPGCNESGLTPVTASVTNNPIIVDTTYNPSNIVCPGTNVTISVSATGGSGAFTYFWTPNGEVADNIVIASATNSTSYSVLINDGTCSKYVSLPLIVGSGGTPPTIAGLNSICEGDSLVLTTPEVSGATYSWNGPSGTGISTNDTLVIPTSAIADGGNYTVFVNDGNACANPSAAYSVAVNPLPNVTVNPIAAICSGSTASVTANNADSFTWSAGVTSTGTNTADVAPSSTATYTVTGTVAGTGCSDTTAFTVDVNQTPVVTVADQSVCLGNAATLTATSTDPDVTYLWSTSATTTTITVTPGTVGTSTYSVVGTNTVTLCPAASVTATVTATNPPAVSATAADPTICLGASTTLTATGDPGATFSWSSGSSTATETVTPPVGTTQYTVTGTVSGCSNTATIDVTVDALPVFNVSNATICAGGTANLTADNSGISYVWQTGVTGTGGVNATANPTTTTTYTVAGTDAATTCSATVTFTVNVNQLPVITAASASVCLGSAAILTASSTSDPDVSYVWSTTQTGSSISVTPSTTGITTYTVAGMNVLTNCTNSITVDVNANALPPVTAVSSSAAICSGNSATLTAGGADSYTWSNGPSGSSQTVSPTTGTSYVVTGTTGGCSATATVTIGVNPSPLAAGTVTNATCNLTNGAVNVTTTGGTPAYTYNWVSLPSGTSAGTTEDLASLAIGAYQLTVTDANLCTFTSPIYTIADGGSINADFTTDVTFGTIPLTVTIDNNTTGASSWGWNFGNGQTSTVQNPTPVTYTASGTYTITMVASNSTGCTETFTVTVIAEIPSSIVIPNIFSPNGDGMNDQFTIFSTGLKTLDVDIFNRWGQKVAVIDGVGQSWDGKLHNGDDASEGTYFYMLKAVGIDGKEYTKEGSMMLVK